MDDTLYREVYRRMNYRASDENLRLMHRQDDIWMMRWLVEIVNAPDFSYAILCELLGCYLHDASGHLRWYNECLLELCNIAHESVRNKGGDRV